MYGKSRFRNVKTFGKTYFLALCCPFKNILFMVLKLKSGFVLVELFYLKISMFYVSIRLLSHMPSEIRHPQY